MMVSSSVEISHSCCAPTVEILNSFGSFIVFLIKMGGSSPKNSGVGYDFRKEEIEKLKSGYVKSLDAIDDLLMCTNFRSLLEVGSDI